MSTDLLQFGCVILKPSHADSSNTTLLKGACKTSFSSEKEGKRRGVQSTSRDGLLTSRNTKYISTSYNLTNLAHILHIFVLFVGAQNEFKTACFKSRAGNYIEVS